MQGTLEQTTRFLSGNVTVLRIILPGELLKGDRAATVTVLCNALLFLPFPIPRSIEFQELHRQTGYRTAATEDQIDLAARFRSCFFSGFVGMRVPNP